MSESYDFEIGTAVDEDYIGVEPQRADVSTTQHDDNLDRSPQSADISTNSVDMSHRFDMQGGSAAASAIDELIDQNAIIENDGRSNTRTFFYPSEAADADQFSRLSRIQEGQWAKDESRDAKNREADRRRWLEGYCARLDMTDYQRRRTEYIESGLNMSHMAYYSSQKIILAIITLVANEDNRFIRDEQMFRDICRDVDTNLNELKQMRKLIRRKSDRL